MCQTTATTTGVPVLQGLSDDDRRVVLEAVGQQRRVELEPPSRRHVELLAAFVAGAIAGEQYWSRGTSRHAQSFAPRASAIVPQLQQTPLAPGPTNSTYYLGKPRTMAHVEIMHWSHTEAGQWRCAVVGMTYQAYRVGDRRWIAEKIDPAGHHTPLGSYDTLKNCKVNAGLDYVGQMKPLQSI